MLPPIPIHLSREETGNGSLASVKCSCSICSALCSQSQSPSAWKILLGSEEQGLCTPINLPLPALKAPTVPCLRTLTSCYPRTSGHLGAWRDILHPGGPSHHWGYFKHHKKTNRFMVRPKERSCLPRGRAKGRAALRGTLPGKPGFMVLPALLLASRQTNGFIPSCYVSAEIRLSRAARPGPVAAGLGTGTGQGGGGNRTTVVRSTGMRCPSKAEERVPAPSGGTQHPSGMLWEHQALPACCPVPALCPQGGAGAVPGLAAPLPGRGARWDKLSPAGTRVRTRAQRELLRRKQTPAC